jgi:hypothetical protein
MEIMPVIAMRTLFVGKAGAHDIAMLTRMGRRGWGAYSADNLKEARRLVAGGGFDLVLALQHLPDGSGYELEEPVEKQKRSLFVEIELFSQRLWIPVVEHGENVFGDRAVGAGAAEAEWEQLLLDAETMVGIAEKGGRRSGERPVAMPAVATGYAPVQISLGPVCGGEESSPSKERPISALARLQLKGASRGLLYSEKKRQQDEELLKRRALPTAFDWQKADRRFGPRPLSKAGRARKPQQSEAG